MNPVPVRLCRRRAAALPLLAGADRALPRAHVRARCATASISSWTCRRCRRARSMRLERRRIVGCGLHARRRCPGAAVAALRREADRAPTRSSKAAPWRGTAVPTREGRRLLVAGGADVRSERARLRAGVEGGANDRGSRGVGPRVGPTTSPKRCNTDWRSSGPGAESCGVTCRQWSRSAGRSVRGAGSWGRRSALGAGAAIGATLSFPRSASPLAAAGGQDLVHDELIVRSRQACARCAAHGRARRRARGRDAAGAGRALSGRRASTRVHGSDCARQLRATAATRCCSWEAEPRCSPPRHASSASTMPLPREPFNLAERERALDGDADSMGARPALLAAAAEALTRLRAAARSAWR